MSQWFRGSRPGLDATLPGGPAGFARRSLVQGPNILMRLGFGAESLAEAARCVVALGEGLLRVGQGGGGLALRQAGQREVVVDPAQGPGIGRGLQGALEIGDSLGVPARPGSEDPAIQKRGSQVGIAIEGPVIVAEGLVDPSHRLGGPSAIEEAFGRAWGQRGADAESRVGVLELPQLVGTQPLVEVGPEVQGPVLEGAPELLGSGRELFLTQQGTTEIVVVSGGERDRIECGTDRGPIAMPNLLAGAAQPCDREARSATVAGLLQDLPGLVARGLGLGG